MSKIQTFLELFIGAFLFLANHQIQIIVDFEVGRMSAVRTHLVMVMIWLCCDKQIVFVIVATMLARRRVSASGHTSSNEHHSQQY